MTTNERLREAMERGGMSAPDVVALTGYSLRSIRYWIAGRVPAREAAVALVEKSIQRKEPMI